MSAKPSVDWDDLHDHLVTEFKECREQVVLNITRMRKVADAIIVCNSESSRQINPDDFAVNTVVNDLKTIERYLKREIQRAKSNKDVSNL